MISYPLGPQPDFSDLPPISEILRKDRVKQKPFKNAYLEEMKPVLYILRILARLPIQISREGKVYAKLFSKWAFITLVVYIGQTFLVVENVIGIINRMRKSEGIESMLYSTNSLILMLFQFYAPLAMIKELPNIIKYLNQWRNFQVEFLERTGRGVKASVRVQIYLAIVGFNFVMLLWFLRFSLSVYSSNWLHVLPYVIVLMSQQMYLFIWVFTCIEMGRISDNLKNFTLSAVNEGATRLWEARRLWLRLSILAQGLGYTLAPSLIVFIINSAINFVSCAYVLLSSNFSKDSERSTFIFTCVASSLYLFILFEFAHRATESIGHDFSLAIARIDTTFMDQKSAREVDLLVQAVHLNPPVIRLAGFVTINRTMCVSLLSNSVTYLIVLVQFNAPSETIDLSRLEEQ